MPILVSEDSGIVTVKLDNGPLNLLDIEILSALRAAFSELTDVRAVILTGNGRAFSAGIDLRRVLNGAGPYIADLLGLLSDTLLEIFVHPRPVVAAIDGHAIAGGAALALACDYRLMSAGRIGFPELAVGVPFPTVALEILRFVVGVTLRSIVTTGLIATLEGAVAVGFVDETAESSRIFEAARERAMRLASVPAETFAISKRQLITPALERINNDCVAQDPSVISAWASEDSAAAIGAYIAGLAEVSP
jgi:enoyl-CoA hydratase